MDDSLFELEPDASGPAPEVRQLTSAQRETIRGLFSRLGIHEARKQFDLVAELVQVRISSADQLAQ